MMTITMTMGSTRLIASIFLCVISSLTPPADAHSFLTDPEPYRIKYLTRSCDGSNCFQACPPYESDAKNTYSRPSVTWARRQEVLIRWARNNHEGGFIQFALVPVNSSLLTLFDTQIHDSLVLYMGCWSQGRYPCNTENLCGSDDDNVGYSRKIKIPPVFPDGTYIFTMTWFGGVRKGYGWYPDYRSCAFVRIQGEGEVKQNASYQPKFKAGRDEERELVTKENVCHAAVDRPLVCPNTGCRDNSIYKAFYGKPYAFEDGRSPESITTARLNAVVGIVSPSPTSIASISSTPTSSMSSSPSYLSTTMPTSTPTSTVSPTPTPSFISSSSPTTSTSVIPSASAPAPTPSVPSISISPSVSPSVSELLYSTPANGICVPYSDRVVCCISRCGVCEQIECFKRKGGPKKCCPNVILKQADSCFNANRPPCVTKLPPAA